MCGKSLGWANEVHGEDVGVSGSGACGWTELSCTVVRTCQWKVSLPGFEYSRRILVVVIKVQLNFRRGELHGSSPLLADDIRVMRDIR